MQLEKDIAAFSKLNPIGHILVPMNNVIEVGKDPRDTVGNSISYNSQVLDQERAENAYAMGSSASSVLPFSIR